MNATNEGRNRTELPVTALPAAGPASRPAAAGPASEAPASPASGPAAPASSAASQASGPAVEEASFFEAVGGEPTFRRLVGRFYQGVATDPMLRALYPEEDLGPAADRLTLFLMQYWGGPNTYSATRGHPRLRMRHAPFKVDVAARDAWLRHMRTAVDELQLPEPHHSALWNYLERAAYFMVNSD